MKNIPIHNLLLVNSNVKLNLNFITNCIQMVTYIKDLNLDVIAVMH